MAEPLSVGLQAVKKAGITPGAVALVTGCGTIGLVTALAARAAGCGTVVVSDVIPEKLALAGRLGMVPVNVKEQDPAEVVRGLTGGWGADVVFEASGSAGAVSGVFEPLCPGGKVVFIGMPVAPVALDIVAAQAKEARIETVFRYAHVYRHAVELMASGRIDVAPLLTDTFPFRDAVAAFEYAAAPRPETVKIIIGMTDRTAFRA
jgi:D-xylulose reductase